MPDAIYSAGDFSSQARFLFETYTGPDGVANIRALVGQTPKVPETNWLEFKSGLARGEDLKHLWSKALGSFANSGGGVVIWGIRAERDSATGIDAVQEEVPVPDVDVLVSRLKELQPPATDPPIKAVIIHPLLLPNEAKKGFVVCFIPESDSKPHRSEFGKNEVKRFNLRIGDTTQECTVPILRQLFHPRVTLKAEMAVKSLNVPQRIGRLSVSEGNAGMLPASAMYAVHLGIKNIGRYSFHNASIGLDCGPASFLEYKFKNSFGEIDVEWIQDVVFLSTVLNPGRERTLLLVIASTSKIINLPFKITLFARDIIPLSAEVALADIVSSKNQEHRVPLLSEQFPS